MWYNNDSNPFGSAKDLRVFFIGDKHATYN